MQIIPVTAMAKPIISVSKLQTPLISLYIKPRIKATNTCPQPTIGNVTAYDRLSLAIKLKIIM